MGEPPKISIVIPTYNEEKYLPKLLESLKAQSFKSFEVIVADWKSSDRTVEIARSFGARVVKCRRRGIGPGRNEGARVARGRLLVFFDADVIIEDRGFLDKVWEKYQKGFLAGSGAARFYDLPKSFEPIKDILPKLWIVFARIRKFYPGWFFFIDRELFFKLGGFKNTYSEDVEFSKRLFKILCPKHFEDLIVKVSARRFKVQGFFSVVSYYLLRDIATEMEKREIFKPLLKSKIVQKLIHYRKVSK